MADAKDRLAWVRRVGAAGPVVVLVLGLAGCTTPATPPKEPAPAVTQLERTTPEEPAPRATEPTPSPVASTLEVPAAAPAEPEPEPATDPEPEPEAAEEPLPEVPEWYALGPNVSGIRVSAGGDAIDPDLREARRTALGEARERLVSVVGERLAQGAIPDRTAVREVEGGYRVFVTVFVDRPEEGPGDGGSDG